jgi:hypothetical protein
MLHQEAFVAKEMWRSLNDVLDGATKVVNHINSKPLNARLFKMICEEMGSEHAALLLQPEVRCVEFSLVLYLYLAFRD